MPKCHSAEVFPEILFTGGILPYIKFDLFCLYWSGSPLTVQLKCVNSLGKQLRYKQNRSNLDLILPQDCKNLENNKDEIEEASFLSQSLDKTVSDMLILNQK